MADKKRTKTRYVDINVTEKSFVAKFIGPKKEEFNFSDISLLRKLLTNEKSRILYTLKHKKPKSIYHLSKILKRDFKSVYQDLKILERFGFIEFHSSKKGQRESLIPVLTIDSMDIVITI